ncbi:hypothetical protein JMJ35_001067 [Cladonia borealis]|uniref:N-alpha-acetyltransferase 40 n=1 Tax=Cladonia borealis TaxID=184061 RepID=A0AA39V7I6_9LECA|nr:hypothetical protein JMJ35_001067 [Cladonia borealis]
MSIETFNALPLAEYRKKFWPHNTTFTHTRKDVSGTYSLSLESSSTLSNHDFRACFNLIAITSSGDYEGSSLGWSAAKKWKEMRLPDLRYIVLKQEKDDKGRDGISEVEGFLSFMLTYEDGYEVIYCYEIHLSPQLQGTGLGKMLMAMMKEVGKKARVEKAMLTVFKANKAAMRFYERLGYEEDEYSPRPRKLRGGVVKEPDYMILSKPLAGESRSLKRKSGLVKKRKAR